MSLITSTPGGAALIGGRALLGATLGWALGPALLAWAIWLGLAHLGPAPGTVRMAWIGLSLLVALSPILTLPGWAMLALLARLLLQQGRYGSLSAALAGALIAGTAAYALGQRLEVGASLVPNALILGAIFATFHRFTLALLRPLAF